METVAIFKVVGMDARVEERCVYFLDRTGRATERGTILMPLSDSR